MLVAGGLGVGPGGFPALAAGAIALFRLVAMPTMTIWVASDDQQQTEMTQFLTNATVRVGAVAPHDQCGGVTLHGRTLPTTSPTPREV